MGIILKSEIEKGVKIIMDMISDNDSNIQILKSFISDFISSLSSKSFSLGLGLMLLDQTHSAMSFGINMIISPLVSLVFLIPIGNLVDRFQHKKILLANILIRVLALIIFLLSLSVFSGKSIILPTLVFVTINAITVNIYTSLVIGVPFIIKQQFHFGNTTVGLLETASAVGMLVGSISLSLLPDRKKERRVLFLSIAIPLLILDLQIIVLGGVFTIFKSQQMISAFGSLSVGIVALSLVHCTSLSSNYHTNKVFRESNGNAFCC